MHIPTSFIAILKVIEEELQTVNKPSCAEKHTSPTAAISTVFAQYKFLTICTPPYGNLTLH